MAAQKHAKIIKLGKPETNLMGFQIEDENKVFDQNGSEIAVLKSNPSAFEDNEIWIFLKIVPQSKDFIDLRVIVIRYY